MNQINSISLSLVCAFSLSINARGASIKSYVAGALQNPSVNAAIEKLNSAELGIEAARLAFAPKGQIGYNYNYNNSQTNGIPTSTANLVHGPFVGVNWTIWDSGARALAIQLADSTATNQRFGVIAVRQALIIQALKSYALWDSQSSMEFIYATLVRALDKLIIKVEGLPKVSPASVKLIVAKRDEFVQKEKEARVQADTFSIQVEGLTGIRPNPYVESTTDEISIITQFYNDLLFDRPLPNLEDSLVLLEKNNIALMVSRENIDALKLTQELNIALNTGVRATLNGSLQSNSGRTRFAAGPITQDAELSQRGRAIGLSVSIPIDVQAYKNLERNRPDLKAALFTRDQLRKDLSTSVAVSHRTITLLRNQVKLNLDEIQKKPDNLDATTDAGCVTVIAYFTSVEQKALSINRQGSALFSSIVDFIGMIFDLESYLSELKG